MNVQYSSAYYFCNQSHRISVGFSIGGLALDCFGSIFGSMSSEHKFVQPGSFSRPYLQTPPSREMVGGRRQTQVFDDKLDIGAVKNLITNAKKANIIKRFSRGHDSPM